MTNGIIMAMLELLSVHDSYTKNHSNGVAQRAKRLAEYMRLSEELITKTYYAGLVHDIGKVLILKDILNKERRLTDSEFELVKKHPEYGANALSQIDKLGDISEAVRYHHERYDGRGYPEGLKGEKIPILSRILSVCDSYDAMINDRPYRKRIKKDEALAEIAACAGSQYDPQIAGLFVELAGCE
jgi:HD-GYP domain-containing protein (c-di-GMP phosphodiesterase class II)